METRKIFKCFISSPGDCEQERKVCQTVVEEVNNGLAKHLGINFETFMWEYDVLPEMGQNGQGIIDRAVLKSQYDIFIGIMKHRFGHPTKKAGSGTQHEFDEALKRKNQNPLPKIIFFFGKESVDPDNFDSEQYQKVKEFQSSISSKGLYVNFSGIDSFKESLREKLELFIKDLSPFEKPDEKVKEVDLVLKRLEIDLNESLKTYNEKSPIWIEPIISTKREIPENPTKNDEFRVETRELIDKPKDFVIKAPSEFGLTSLAHYLKLEAWKIGKVFLYIDSRATKKHKVVKDIYKEVEVYYHKKTENIECILLDSVSFEENGMMQVIKNICDEFADIPLIILNSLDNNFFLKTDEDDKVEITRKFSSYYLLPLPQTEVRKLVTSYSKYKSLEEDKEVILNKVTKDLVSLNMHRTPKNCISILRASSKFGAEYSPVNRTKLLETILNTIFEEYDIPTYRNKKPDVKDCSFVLGYLCEQLVINKSFEFTESFFKSKLEKFCEDNFIDLDLNYLLQVLVDNAIFAKTNQNGLFFKNSYWAFYFIAQRMNMNKGFLARIFDKKDYVDFPEVIEFYTGIDRNKDDALQLLYDDLNDTLTTVKSKVNIPDNLNPFKSISWTPDIASLEKEEAIIGENVISSGLPDAVKDKYDDKHYNQIKPYNQVINTVMRDYSFLVLMRQISATSRALRNSDFVEPSLKKQTLDKITECWNEINKLLIVIAPLLADKGNVAFEGAKFYIEEEDFVIDDPEMKRLAVLLSVPSNVVKYFKDDLFSNKIAPLLINKAVNEANSLIKHELMLLLIAERAKGWNKLIDNYIVSLDKNSFYLSDVLTILNFQMDYKTTELGEKRIMAMLAKKCRAKHIFNSKNPDIGLINRLQKLESGNKKF